MFVGDVWIARQVASYLYRISYCRTLTSAPLLCYMLQVCLGVWFVLFLEAEVDGYFLWCFFHTLFIGWGYLVSNFKYYFVFNTLRFFHLQNV